jgi:hypothetical protein
MTARSDGLVVELWVSALKLVDAAVLSRIGYVLLSVVPVIIVGGVVWRHDGWFAIIENADNLAAVAALVQWVLFTLRRHALLRPAAQSTPAP